jgi:hypothetical protein
MLNIMNGLRRQLKMTQSSLWVMREHKRIVALRIYNKRKSKNQPPQKDGSPYLEHMCTEDKEIYELRQLMGNTEDLISKVPETGRERFRNYEYKKHERKLKVLNKLIPVWLEHPNPKYARDIIRMRCQHGIKCKGTKALTTTKPCLALHPWEWGMFSLNIYNIL